MPHLSTGLATGVQTLLLTMHYGDEKFGKYGKEWSDLDLK